MECRLIFGLCIFFTSRFVFSFGLGARSTGYPAVQMGLFAIMPSSLLSTWKAGGEKVLWDSDMCWYGLGFWGSWLLVIWPFGSKTVSTAGFMIFVSKFLTRIVHRIVFGLCLMDSYTFSNLIITINL